MANYIVKAEEEEHEVEPSVGVAVEDNMVVHHYEPEHIENEAVKPVQIEPSHNEVGPAVEEVEHNYAPEQPENEAILEGKPVQILGILKEKKPEGFRRFRVKNLDERRKRRHEFFKHHHAAQENTLEDE